MGDPIEREEYQGAMARLHERLDGIATNTTKIEVAAEYMTKATERIHEAIFGNGKPGALHRITQAWTTINFQWWVLGGVLGILGSMIFVFVTHVSK